MAEVVRLVNLVIPDAQVPGVLLLHRTDHQQWQLPGGRIGDSSTVDRGSADLAAVRHGQEELGIEIDSHSLQWLGFTTFRQAGFEYDCKWVTPRKFTGAPFYRDRLTYDALEQHDLLAPIVHKRRSVYSPSVQDLAKQILNGRLTLSGPDTVQ